MKKIAYLISIAAFMVSGIAAAAPWTLLSDVSYTQKGGVNALKVDFTIPVHYVAHFPARHGKELSIILRFNKNKVKDISQLPLLESINAPEAEQSPVQEVTYMTDRHQRPKLVIRFKHDVNFNVSQVMGINSLVIFMPDEKMALDEVVAVDEPKVSPMEQAMEKFKSSIPEPKKSGSTDTEKLKKQFRAGRKALRKNKYKKAIQIFSALLSQPKSELSKASLELLGVARERNNQAAHAKAIYKRYLEKYPTGDDAVRVKQRLAELINEQMKPRAKLKESQSKRVVRKKDTSKLTATLSQYISYRHVVPTGGERIVTSTNVNNNLNATWRVRRGGWDIRNNFSGTYDYETVDGETDGFEIGKMYSKIRNSTKGVFATIGRQSGASMGVRRFDGVYLGYRLHSQVRTNFIFGYPVEFSDKTRIQTDKPMVGVNAEFSDIIKGWDLSPFYIQENEGAITDRRAVGAGLNYFNKDRGNFNALVDYDLDFGEMNYFLFQGNYIGFKPSSISLYMQYRRAPDMYRLSNVARNEAYSVEEFLNVSNIERLREVAAERTDLSRIIGFGFSHDFSSKLHLVADISRSDYLSNTAAPTAGSDINSRLSAGVVSSKSSQVDASMRLIVDEWLEPKDTLLLHLNRIDATDFVYTNLTGRYRFFYQTLVQMEPILTYIDRRNDNGSRLIKRIPGLRMHYRAKQNLRYFVDLRYEVNSSSIPGNSSRSASYYIGYSWGFL